MSRKQQVIATAIPSTLEAQERAVAEAAKRRNS
jgi:hypothetical protein